MNCQLGKETINAPSPYNDSYVDFSINSKYYHNLQSRLNDQLTNAIDIPAIIGKDYVFMADDVDKIYLAHDHAQVFARSFRCSNDHVNKAIDSCLVARQAWSELSQASRNAVFLKAAELIATKYRTHMTAATILGQNKIFNQAQLDAVCKLVDLIRYQAYYGEKLHRISSQNSFKGIWNYVQARSLEGFVFAVGPFNFSSISLNLAIAPAMMGCTVLLKPSLQASYATFLGLSILKKCGLPDGVINLVNGDHQMIGETALNHPMLSGLHFTGSTKTFEYLNAKVAANFSKYRNYPKIVAETGGKGFVFADVSADKASLIEALIEGAFDYQGQQCSAGSRAYIPQSIWSAIKQQLIANTAQLKIGSPVDFENNLAAVVDDKAYKKIMSYIEFAKDSNDYEILCGGQGDNSKGYFIKPTIIQTNNNDCKLFKEEIFGPVLTVYVYPDDQVFETAQMCDNDTKYGLTGAVFATDRMKIDKLTNIFKYTAGNFCINVKPTGAMAGHQPFGGSRNSGTNDKSGSELLLQRWINYRTVKESF